MVESKGKRRWRRGNRVEFVGVKEWKVSACLPNLACSYSRADRYSTVWLAWFTGMRNGEIFRCQDKLGAG